MRRAHAIGLAFALGLAACERADLTVDLPLLPEGPEPVLEGTELVDISAHESVVFGARTCVVAVDGVVHCFDSPSADFGSFARVPTTVPFDRVFVGGSHVCALTAAGAAWCWGDNSFGQLGDGTRTQRLAPGAVAGPAFATLSLGSFGSCGVTQGGELHCWGSYPVSTGPCDFCSVDDTVPVHVAPTISFEAVAFGGGHVCGVAVGGELFCWGTNFFGQLGTGDLMDRFEPTAVALGGDAVAVTAGSTHTCLILASGAAQCWGDNATGQLGTGSFNPAHRPASVAGGLSFSRLDADASVTCGLTTDGVAYCWGNNSAGVVGFDLPVFHPTPTRVRGAEPFSEIAITATHGCAITPDGRGYCWGEGQL